MGKRQAAEIVPRRPPRNALRVQAAVLRARPLLEEAHAPAAHECEQEEHKEERRGDAELSQEGLERWSV